MPTPIESHWPSGEYRSEFTVSGLFVESRIEIVGPVGRPLGGGGTVQKLTTPSLPPRATVKPAVGANAAEIAAKPSDETLMGSGVVVVPGATLARSPVPSAKPSAIHCSVAVMAGERPSV